MIAVRQYAAKQRLVSFIKQFGKRWRLSALMPTFLIDATV